MKINWIPFFCMISIPLAACGGSDGGSGVDRSKTLDAVTAEEAMDICESAADLVSEEDSIRVNCYFGAIIAAALDPEVDCETEAQACIDNPEPSEEDDCAVDDADLPECASMVTVGEIEDCQEANADAFAELADSISCDTDLESVGEQEPECAEIQEKCPELFEDEGQ